MSSIINNLNGYRQVLHYLFLLPCSVGSSVHFLKAILSRSSLFISLTVQWLNSYDFHGRNNPMYEAKPLGSGYVTCLKGIFEKFKCTSNCYIRTPFKSYAFIRIHLLRTRAERNMQ
jgi:hypothetical protein